MAPCEIHGHFREGYGAADVSVHVPRLSGTGERSYFAD
jgi:hypothetical protein